MREIAWMLPSRDYSAESIARVHGRVAEVPGDTHALVIGKSPGPLSAGLVAERGIPAVWITPLPSVPDVV